MKSRESRSGWYDGTSELSVKIHRNIVRSNSGYPVLKYFDGSTMRKYQVPHKIFESIHCISKPDFCQQPGYDSRSSKDVPLSDFEVKPSTVGEGSGRGLFSTIDIEKGTTIGLETAVNPVYFSPSSLDLIENYQIDDVYNYADGYGWTSAPMGAESIYVEPNILTFVNHGCNGTYNIDSIGPHIEKLKSGKLMFTEQNVEKSDFPPSEPIYSPYHARHILHQESPGVITIKDISVGDEIFSDYLFYSIGSLDEFYEEAQVLKRICSGDEVGLITMSERSATSSVS